MKKHYIYLTGFWLLIVFAIGFVFNVIRINPYKFNLTGFNYPLETIKTNIEFDKKYNPDKILICYEDYCQSLGADTFRNVYYSEFGDEIETFFDKKIKNITLALPEGITAHDIKALDMHVGTKGYYYDKESISKLEQKEISIKLDKLEQTRKYTALIFPEVNNYKGILKHACIITLTILHNWKLFIVSYIALFMAFCIYVLNKEKFNFKLNFKNTHYALGIIIILGALLRFMDISYFPFWADETYTKGVAIHDFKSCFLDAGNPPLFFILEFLFAKIFGKSELALRFLPCVFSVAFIPVIYLLFKKIYNEKTALFAALLASINTIFINYAQEARAYSLDMLLSVGAIYLLFKYLKNTNIKNLTFYAVIVATMANTNYYLIILAMSNFIWGCADLIENKKTPQIKNFFLANCIAALTLLPYVIMTSKTALSNSFNAWIPKLSAQTILYTIDTYFNNKWIFLSLCIVVLLNIVVCYLPLKDKNKERENLYIYLIYTMSFILISACLISVFIKPIFHKRILMCLYGLLFTIEVATIAGVIEFKNLTKPMSIIKGLYHSGLVLMYLTITAPMPVREIYSLGDYMKFIKNDSKMYKGYEIHALACDYKEYLRAYPEMESLDIHWHFIYSNGNEIVRNIKKEDYVTGDKKAVIYFNPIGVDIVNIAEFNPRAYIYRSGLEVPSVKLIYN